MSQLPKKMDHKNNTGIEEAGLSLFYKTGLGIFFSFALIGIISNIALIVIYKQKDLKVRFNCLMLSLAVFDLMTILAFALTAIVELAVGTNTVLPFLSGALLNCSAYTMTAIAIEQYLLLCRYV